MALMAVQRTREQKGTGSTTAVCKPFYGVHLMITGHHSDRFGEVSVRARLLAAHGSAARQQVNSLEDYILFLCIF